MTQTNEKFIQRGVTWLSLLNTVIGLCVVLGGAAFKINLDVQRHEWWIQRHQQDTERRAEEMHTKAVALDAMIERVTRIEEKLDALREDIARHKP